jgi:predicted GNAT family N-acyltransferase
MSTFRNTPNRRSIVLLSDALTYLDRERRNRSTQFAQSLRTALQAAPHVLLALLAVVDTPQRITDIDVCVSPTATPDEFRAAVIRAATALRLKAPPPLQPSQRADVRVGFANREQLDECLHLRRRVYEMLCYLPDNLTGMPDAPELDGYDDGAVHFAATVGRTVVGTARLILDRPLPDGNAAPPPIGIDGTRVKQARWLRDIAVTNLGAARERFARAPFFPLPLLTSGSFANWPQALIALSGAAELSRVIVDPQYRGTGISRHIVRRAIQVATTARIPLMVLDCIPAHTAMYEKYGFRQLRNHEHHDRDLDQYAVAMALPLTTTHSTLPMGGVAWIDP